MTKVRTLVLSICLRNAFHNHFPEAAPCIKPGTSTTLNFSSPTCTDHRCGISVVNEYSATFALVFDIVLIRLDFPTLGVPIKATSAKSCNSSVSSLYCAGSPNKANSGYWFIASLNCIFPQPPAHQGTAIRFSPTLLKWWRMCHFVLSLTTVPTGTDKIRSSASAPYWSLDLPGSPALALNSLWYLKYNKVLSSCTAWRMTDHHFHPFHPDGQPYATPASCLHATIPFHPLPEWTAIVTSSRNCMYAHYEL